jgi:hypothetical protein
LQSYVVRELEGRGRVVAWNSKLLPSYRLVMLEMDTNKVSLN